MEPNSRPSVTSPTIQASPARLPRPFSFTIPSLRLRRMVVQNEACRAAHPFLSCRLRPQVHLSCFIRQAFDMLCLLAPYKTHAQPHSFPYAPSSVASKSFMHEASVEQWCKEFGASLGLGAKLMHVCSCRTIFIRAQIKNGIVIHGGTLPSGTPSPQATDVCQTSSPA